MSSMLDLQGGDAPTIQIPHGPPADAGTPTPTAGGGENEAVSHLQAAIKALTAYQQVEPDAGDKAAAAKLLAQIHQLLAKDQQEADQQLSGQLNPATLRRAGVIG